ncbi:MAG: hypothetical protein ACI8PZ_007451 [Myxococcota bacterium]|jgi:hypothetical protein
MGLDRSAHAHHKEPEERAWERHTYDGFGRLSKTDGMERRFDPITGDADTLVWTHRNGYDAEDRLVHEVRTGLAPKIVHRAPGYLHDTSVGQTIDALPMLRVVDGRPHVAVTEASGRAAWVFDDAGAERSHEAVGATGVALHQTGARWHQDGLHGSQPDLPAGLVNHGVRHARLDDGLWLQPEPLLLLGPTNGNLAMPPAYGPAYAAGDTNSLLAPPTHAKVGALAAAGTVAWLAPGAAGGAARIGGPAAATVARVAGEARAYGLMTSLRLNAALVNRTGLQVAEMFAGEGVIGVVGPAAAVGVASVDDLSAAAAKTVSGNLTAAGRAMQKHGARTGSAFPAAKGTPAQISKTAQAIVDDILTAPGSTRSTINLARYGGDVTDVVGPDGRGVRFGPDGDFIGLLEPPG